jgi:uncharacterized protein YcsI (UPF0317 family)
MTIYDMLIKKLFVRRSAAVPIRIIPPAWLTAICKLILLSLKTNMRLILCDFVKETQNPAQVVGVSDTGIPMMTTLGQDIDIRSDVPSYNIYRHGQLAEKLQ